MIPPIPISAKGSAPYEVIASIPKEYRQNLLEGMRGVANNIGVYVPENYEFFAKTGTAETGAGDFLYITGCLRNVADKSAEKPVYSDYSNYAQDGSYIIVMQLQNPADFGFNFASETGFLYQGIVNIVLSEY